MNTSTWWIGLYQRLERLDVESAAAINLLPCIIASSRSNNYVNVPGHIQRGPRRMHQSNGRPNGTQSLYGNESNWIDTRKNCLRVYLRCSRGELMFVSVNSISLLPFFYHLTPQKLYWTFNSLLILPLPCMSYVLGIWVHSWCRGFLRRRLRSWSLWTCRFW